MIDLFENEASFYRAVLLGHKSLPVDYWNDDVDAYLDALAIERVDVKALVVTPGGRVGDNTPFSRSRTSNWVAKMGGLPDYVREVAHALMRKGKLDESSAIRRAIGILENWASGKGKVSAKVRAAAAKAVAEFRGKGAASRAKTAAKRTASAAKWAHENIELKGDKKMGTATDEDFRMEFKEVSVKGLTVDDEDEGIVTAIVSVTGMVDRVNDNILPGAYAKSLAQRTPKGVWNHDWATPVSKTLEVRELMPGDPDLPKSLDNGQPWPKDAGALKVKMKFNLDTDTGARAFKNVRFFGPDQEWSIGYVVPPGGADLDTKTNTRVIRQINVYEYSPVLFGAMPIARTVDVKTAQNTWRALNGLEMKFEDDEDIETKKDFTAEKRRELAKAGNALPDGSYPIENRSDLEHAVTLAQSGHGNVAAAKRLIIRRAKELDCMDCVPTDWVNGGAKELDTWPEYKDLDTTPYAGQDDYDDDDDTDTGAVTIQVGVADLMALQDLSDEIEALIDKLTGAGGFDRDAMDGDDTSSKWYDDDDFESKAVVHPNGEVWHAGNHIGTVSKQGGSYRHSRSGQRTFASSDEAVHDLVKQHTRVLTGGVRGGMGRVPFKMDDLDIEYKDTMTETGGSFSDIIDQLSEFRDDIGNYDQLSDLAAQYDQKLSDGDVNGALQDAQTFVDSLEQAMENASEQDTQNAISQAVQSIAEALQEDASEGDDEGQQDDSEGSDDGSDTGSDVGDQSGDGTKEVALNIDTKALDSLRQLVK